LAGHAKGQSRIVPIPENCKKLPVKWQYWRKVPTKAWEFLPTRRGNICPLRRVGQPENSKEYRVMIGKLAGAWLGSKAAGRQGGAKGALLGYGAAALARRSVPALAAVTLGGWAFKKMRERRRERAATYPSEATPSSD
jgi:hypothetical protein